MGFFSKKSPEEKVKIEVTTIANLLKHKSVYTSQALLEAAQRLHLCAKALKKLGR